MISVNQYITDNFDPDMQHKIRQAIKKANGFSLLSLFQKRVNLDGQRIWSYRDIFLSRIEPETLKSVFIMGQFQFHKTEQGQKFWHDYVLKLREEENERS